MAINNELMGLLTKRLTAFNEQIDMPFDFYDNLQARMQIEERYRFLRFEMSGLYMNYPKVKQTFEISLQRKQEEIKKLIAHQIKFGYIVPLDEVELDFLCSNLWIINSQWEIYWLINKEKSSKLRILQGKLNFLYLFKPYLTQKALDRSNFLQTLKFIRQEIKNAE